MRPGRVLPGAFSGRTAGLIDNLVLALWPSEWVNAFLLLKSYWSGGASLCQTQKADTTSVYGLWPASFQVQYCLRSQICDHLPANEERSTFCVSLIPLLGHGLFLKWSYGTRRRPGPEVRDSAVTLSTPEPPWGEVRFLGPCLLLHQRRICRTDVPHSWMPRKTWSLQSTECSRRSRSRTLEVSSREAEPEDVLNLFRRDHHSGVTGMKHCETTASCESLGRSQLLSGPQHTC